MTSTPKIDFRRLVGDIRAMNFRLADHEIENLAANLGSLGTAGLRPDQVNELSDALIGRKYYRAWAKSESNGYDQLMDRLGESATGLLPAAHDVAHDDYASVLNSARSCVSGSNNLLWKLADVKSRDNRPFELSAHVADGYIAQAWLTGKSVRIQPMLPTVYQFRLEDETTVYRMVYVAETALVVSVSANTTLSSDQADGLVMHGVDLSLMSYTDTRRCLDSQSESFVNLVKTWVFHQSIKTDLWLQA